jgi:hypothetical protein
MKGKNILTLVVIVVIVIGGVWLASDRAPQGSGDSTGLAATPIDVSLRPREASYAIGSTVEVEMMVRDAVDLYGFEADFDFDSSKLEFKNLRYESFFTGDNAGTYYSVSPETEKSGMLDGVAATKLGDTALSGDGVIAVLEFEVIGEGNAFVSIRDHTFINYDLQEFKVNLENAESIYLSR